MTRKKKWFEKRETKRNFLIAFLIALVLLAIEAIRYVITLVIDILIFGNSVEKVVGSYSYAFGLLVAISILAYLIYKTEKSFKE